MKGNIIRERLTKLRKCMKEKGVDALYIPTSDFHSSEYAGGYFRCREFFSGFTGSAGTLLVLQEEAGLWTDGRYFLQAEEQLKDTGITLYKMKEANVPSIRDFLERTLKEGQTLAVDGRVISSGQWKGFVGVLEKKNIKICLEQDIAGTVWEQLGKRPQLSKEPVWELSDIYSGKSRKEKLSDVRKMMEKQKANIMLISSLDDIAWLFNLRGNDIPYVPVFLSYALIEKEKVRLYSVEEAFSMGLKEKLEKEQIFLVPYQQIYEDITKIEEKQAIWFDQTCTNAALVQKIPEHCLLIRKKLPTVKMKAIKNRIEIENERKAHLYDGIAYCKFLYWLKQHNFEQKTKISIETLTEISVAKKLEEFRKQQKTYLMPSFEPISGYAEHGAIVHYSATEESNAILYGENFLLMDTGAHYLEGTTDITRTIALGKLTEKQKEHYTAVLCGNIRLSLAKFPYGVCGVHLDILARGPLWDRFLDYKHGTGHGVGYLLNVHEGPNHIRREINARNSSIPLEEGMITSNEPGVYLEGEYGIRLENMILCKKIEKKEKMELEKEQFMEFETLTLVPFEQEAILPEMLSEKEKEWLNQYHKRVYQEISPYLTKEEALWLKEAVREIK